MRLFENIYFIGGIHGVGKGTICKEITSRTNLSHITASEVLKWNEISLLENKLVENISSTQDRLIYGLENLIVESKEYLLDGHFCLLNSFGVPSKINEETFDIINPKIILVVIDDVQKIIERLESRDHKKYDVEVLTELQEMEIEYGKYLSKKYCVPYIEIVNNNYERFLDILNR